jgi:hypothetical protein
LAHATASRCHSLPERCATDDEFVLDDDGAQAALDRPLGDGLAVVSQSRTEDDDVIRGGSMTRYQGPRRREEDVHPVWR